MKPKSRERVYSYIVTYIGENQIPPTRREIAAGVGLCLSNANYHVRKLATSERIKIVPDVARGIILPKETAANGQA